MAVCVIFIGIFACFTGVFGIKYVSHCGDQSKQSLFWKELIKDYDPHSGPPGVVDVFVSIRVHNVPEVDLIGGMASVNLNLRQQWTDPRLRFKCDDGSTASATRFVFGRKQLDQIWSPELVSPNYMDDIDSAQPFFYFTAPEQGKIWSSRQLLLTVPCTADFHRFPFDTITCFIRVTTVTRSHRHVNIVWEADEPIKIDPKVRHLQEFSFLRAEAQETNETNGHAPLKMLDATVSFKRYVAYFILECYVPSTLTVLMAWLSFFLNPKLIHQRSSFGTATVLAILLQYLNVLENIPKVGYTKAIDVWMFGCLSFVAYALMQYVCVAYLLHYRQPPAEEARVRRMDRCSFMGFMMAFLVFIIIYVCVFV